VINVIPAYHTGVAIRRDEELDILMRGTIAGGGVRPFIDNSLKNPE
jgi:hypothetical protein